MESCEKHPHELGVALCARCGGSWCAHCLVQVRGPRKAPYCIECAMFVGGVRSSATRPALSRRQMKARVKEVAAIAAAAAVDLPEEAEEADRLELPAPEPVAEAPLTDPQPKPFVERPRQPVPQRARTPPGWGDPHP